MTTIIGIDPGSQRTGYGIIQIEGNQHIHVASGTIDLMRIAKTLRLRKLYLVLQEIVQLYQPMEAAIEQVFMHANPSSALKLGQARGAALVAFDHIPVSEYSAKEVKKSVVGYGAATKEQVQFMVARLLNVKNTLSQDAADALAIAWCHAQARIMKKIGETSR